MTDYATIFNTWTRFSHDSTSNQPANAGELSAWSFDSGTGVISSTTNSGTFIGFVSPESYSDYTIKTQLKSTAGDDDAIGLLVGWYVDPADNRQYTLSAIRDTGGFTNSEWSIWYNFGRSDATKLVNGDSLVPSSTGTWNLYPNGATIQATRVGNFFTFVTSQINSTSLDNATTLTLDLDSNPILDKFKGQSPYGFGVWSQAGSTFTVLNFAADANEIFDTRNGDLYTLQSGSWFIDGARDIWTEIGIGRFCHNQTTGKTFYVANSSAVIKVAVNSGPQGPQGPQVLKVHRSTGSARCDW